MARKKNMIKSEEVKPSVISIFPKQKEMINASEPEVLCVGGAGSSKSVALCLKLAKEVVGKPGNTALLCRRFSNTLRRTILVNLLDGIPPVPPILAPGTYEFNSTTLTIKIHGGGTIYCCGLDDIQKIRSMTVGLVIVDELSEVEDVEVWQELRLRIRSPQGSMQIIGAMNPGSISSWQYKYFYLDKNPNRRAIQTSSFDNLALPKSYKDVLNSLDGSLRKRMVDGEFADSEKMVYGDTLINKCMVDKLPNKDEIQKWFISIDYGYTNPCFFSFAGLDCDNNLWVYECLEKTKLLQNKIIEWVVERKEYDPTVTVDPSAAGLIADLQANVPHVIKAENDILVGVDRVRSLMAQGKLKIDSNCIDLIKSMRGYMYGDDGKPIKKGEHGGDSIRYLVSTCWNEINTAEPMSQYVFA